MTATTTIQILLVEDNPGDARLAQEALRQAQVANRVRTVKDGRAAVTDLRDPATPRPDLIILDLDMPDMDGYAVLREVKGDPTLRTIPILVLSGLRGDNDIVSAYDLHANAYVMKPADLKDFNRFVQAFDDFWLKTAKLPSTMPHGS